MISPVDEFHRVVTEAVITAATGKIVTIGITPTEPSSAFGYIHASESLASKALPMLTPWTPSWKSRTPLPHRSTWIPVSTPGTQACSWRRQLMLKHLEANEPELYAGIMEIANAWDTPRA